MDKITDQLRDILTPEQTAKFLLIAERVSFIKNNILQVQNEGRVEHLPPLGHLED